MPSLIREFLDSPTAKKMTDVRNIGLYIFTLIILAITWSGIKTVENNYGLQKKIATLQQQNTIADLQNSNQELQNQYLQTDQYLELAAREQLGLAFPGETVLLVPQSVAMRYINPNAKAKIVAVESSQNKSKLQKNIEAWRDFLFGHKLTSQ